MSRQLKCRCGHSGYPRLFQKSTNVVGRCEVCDAFIKNVPHEDTIYNPHGIVDLNEEESIEDAIEEASRLDFIEGMLESLSERLDKLEEYKND